MDASRTTAQRRTDVMATLERQADGWLATADADGTPRLIVVSCAWTGDHLILATRSASPTARNLDVGRLARVGLGATDDVVMVDAVVEASEAADGRDGGLGRSFAGAVGWDPAAEGADWVCYRLRPTRIQAYRGYGERRGADVMREGRWLA